MKMLISIIAICGCFAVAFFGVVVLFSFDVWLGFVLCVMGIGGAIMGTKIYDWIFTVNNYTNYHGFNMVVSG